jgi:hypothetical protein
MAQQGNGLPFANAGADHPLQGPPQPMQPPQQPQQPPPQQQPQQPQPPQPLAAGGLGGFAVNSFQQQQIGGHYRAFYNNAINDPFAGDYQNA